MQGMVLGHVAEAGVEISADFELAALSALLAELDASSSAAQASRSEATRPRPGAPAVPGAPATAKQSPLAAVFPVLQYSSKPPNM